MRVLEMAEANSGNAGADVAVGELERARALVRKMEERVEVRKRPLPCRT